MNYLLIIIAIICSVFQSVLCKIFGQKYKGESRLSPMVYSFFMGIFITLATLAVNGFSFKPSLWTVLFGCLNALLSYLYNYALIKASNMGPFSFVMLLALFGCMIIPIVFSAIFFQEIPTVCAYIGIVLMLTSFVLMNGGTFALKGSPILYYILTFLLFFINGAYATVQKIQSHMFSGAERAEMIMITYFGQAVISLFLLLFKEKKKALPALKCGKSAFSTVVLCSLCTTVAMNLYFILVAKMPIAIVVTIIDGGTLLGSLLASLAIFGERPKKVQIAGMAVSTIAMVLLALA